MHSIAPAKHATPPRLEGRRVTFEIEVDGAWMPCAISEAAIFDVAGLKHMRPNEMLGVFLRARLRIEAIARAKLLARAGQVQGTLNIWSDDIEPPPDAAPGAKAAVCP